MKAPSRKQEEILLRKLKYKGDKQWCGCFTSHEVLLLAEYYKVTPVKYGSWSVAYCKDLTSKGETESVWFYFDIRKGSKLWIQMKKYNIFGNISKVVKSITKN